MIDFQDIQNLIASELQTLVVNDDKYADVKVYISNEQQFVKTKDREKGAIYIVIKYLQASINFGQTVLPITLNIISERNKMNIAQTMLMEFAQTYNLTMNEDNTIKQVYTSPMVTSNFNEIFDGFRSVLYTSGTFLISENTNTGEVYYNDTLVNLITMGISFNIQLDSQPYASSGNFTKSVGKFGTYTLALVTYLTTDELVNECLKITCKEEDVNTTFPLTIKFKNGVELSADFKMSSFDFQQDIGNLPTVSITFTN